MSILSDAIKDVLPRRKVKMEDKPIIRNLTVPPPPQPVVEQPKEEKAQEVAVEDVIVAIYEQVVELRKDVNALIRLWRE